MNPLDGFDRFQQRHNSLAIPLAVLKKFSDDGASRLAAVFAYYAFFSIFPLLLVFVTVLGFVLHSHPHTISSVENSIYKSFPSLDKVIDIKEIKGSAVALIVGIATSLWSGLGVTGQAQNALDTVWAVPRKSRPNFFQSRLRGLGLLVTLGALFILATLVSGIAIGSSKGLLAGALGIVVSFLVNCLLFLAAFRWMTSGVPTRDLRAGVIFAAVVWTILQAIGGAYVGHIANKLSASYAQFAIILALLVWLHLGAQLTMYAVELNVVLERRLYPRTLAGPPEMPADQATLTALAKAEERNDIETVEVSFEEPEDDTAPRSGSDHPPHPARSRVDPDRTGTGTGTGAGS